MPIYHLSEKKEFPPVHHAQNGLLAFGGDLSPERLLLAYQHGIFPWYSEGDPILWHAPEERMVLFPDGIHVSRRLERTLRAGRFSVAADTDFEGVITACAMIERCGENGTWIHPEMIDAYVRLHTLGFAHSIECRIGDSLVGGLYGVSLGGAFFGESMFSRERDASKAALVTLARLCERWKFVMIDCQMHTDHLERMGARLMTRPRFTKLLKVALTLPTRVGRWRLNGE